MSRAWARLALLGATVAACGVAAAALLVDHDAGGPAPRPTVGKVQVEPPLPSAEPSYGGGVAADTSARAPGATASVPPVVELRPSTPTRVNDVTLATEPKDLATWVEDKKLDPVLRYSALRQLESLAPADAVTAALQALDDTTPLVRLNAIAVLSRSDDPRAQEALSRIDPKSQRLAQALVARR